VLEETGVAARTIESWTHRLSIQPGVLSEAVDWTDRMSAVVGGACSTSSRST
jgi:hypothetical protein